MTNHPHRQRDDDGEPSPVGDLAASVPAVAELADEMAAKPQQLPPGLSPNGHTPVARLIEQLPQMLFQALAQALSSVRAAGALKCAVCVAARIQWAALHAADVKTAEAQMAAALAAMEPGDPRRGQLNPLMFLPPEVQQGVPPVLDGEVMTGGAVYCGNHVPGLQQAGGRKEFLIANAPLSSALIAEAMGQNAA